MGFTTLLKRSKISSSVMRSIKFAKISVAEMRCISWVLRVLSYGKEKKRKENFEIIQLKFSKTHIQVWNHMEKWARTMML